MDEYFNELKRRNITRLCHFTKSSNLPFILGDGEFEKNGILSSQYIKKSNYLEELDKQRMDNHLDYVCCSIQRINSKYFKRRREQEKGDLFNQWAVLYIDPKIINDTTLFSPVNAATARGANLHGGVDAFRNLFGNPISYVRYGRQNYMDRATNLPDNFTTDVKAEVLIKDRIPKNCIIGVAFPDDTYQVEKQRLSFCLGNGNLGINIERLEDE